MHYKKKRKEKGYIFTAAEFHRGVLYEFCVFFYEEAPENADLIFKWAESPAKIDFGISKKLYILYIRRYWNAL